MRYSVFNLKERLEIKQECQLDLTILNNRNKENYFSYQSENKKKNFIITDDLNFFNNNKGVYDRAPEKKRPFFVKFIDLRDFGSFKYANVKITKIKKYKAAKSVSLITKLTRHIIAQSESINNEKFDNATLQAFDETMHNVDFFKFKEQCFEYRFRIRGIDEKGKIIGKLELNVGDLAVVYCPEYFHIESTEDSTERKGNRCSLVFPVYSLDGKEYVAEVNYQNKRYKEMIEQNRIVEKMLEI
ncbi:TPA: hypothetical protein L4847_005746 [Pseudomonas aeruginosa]|nr:hypothetical protein [Pseudomonas aeruginosa]HBO7136236.1 hypothetical protein [Pseudomonas aeruginosa]HBO7336899.1 hypothetical protein [Pseudomonas aeruginosa]HBO7400421.1 hypothetical protein [Pseudomonas aeruginosa]